MDADPSSPVPDFDAAVAGVLRFIGVSPFLIAAVLLAFALESWLSNGKRMARAAVVVGGATARGTAWLVRQRPVRIVVTVATTITVLIAQMIMLRLSYVGGSIVASLFDPVRWKALDAAFGSSPLLFIDPVFLERFLAVDLFSVSYVLVTIVLMVLAYREKAPTRLLWFVTATPFWFLLWGSVVMTVLSLGFDLLFFALHLLTDGKYAWPFLRDYVLSAPSLTVDLVSVIYCGGALAAIGGAALVRRLWTAPA
ncbi:hypothetical protein NLX83_15550 [Allokutzneria sp. A3M-2-11 16]|uniref:hypothetical protein n=1 Tax=Allokutzneria sp. A3M-2-11 16 TaxID=2962043 RepID=UPI0020B763A0|nr:hypothetical protein [Allokutzneria sp. A3M-2-11 16]MCP3800682.1 hypothetical protein [Allokutzneria sp. A3M-2-11 16]